MGRVRHPAREKIRSRVRRTPRAAAVVMAAVLGATSALTGTAAAQQERGWWNDGTRYYVDCGSGDDGAPGTSPGEAWKTLAKVNTVTFEPGDTISLRRGTTCGGTLEPKGSGTARAPISLDAYGYGARPVINGGGARAAVFLHDVQGWEIRGLEITNPGPDDGAPRIGIYVLLDDYGTGEHYVVDNVKIHDVPGCDCLQAEKENSGGIVFKAAGSETPTGFDGIRVTRNQISDIDNVGIGTVSQWVKRDLYPGGTNHWVPMRNVHVTWNQVTNTGGDGILVSNGVDSVTAHNKVDGFGLRGVQAHAGILAFNSDRPVVQYNEVTGGSSNPPSFAFSVDAGNRDLVYQYNYSHDNDGPFILFCAFAGTSGDGAKIRYNLSENDLDLAIGTFTIPIVSNGCDNPIEDVEFYNNVIHSERAGRLVRSLPHTPIKFSNNVFSGRFAGASIVDDVGVYDHNVYRNVTGIPAGDQHAITQDPRFTAPGSGPWGYRLRCGSPAIGAGVDVAGDGGRDLFGNRIPSPPNIGVYQGRCAR
ncbi:right-handed parallel beta-helix repeat-containing protein [Spirillospora sp. NPDC048824]|uniref:right-handed parallel beta-helix repeat-containing protein n=1 Tax=Spirillospora sp. NPDC048824 TaxID=3364526 RepID=UPI00371DA6B4